MQADCFSAEKQGFAGAGLRPVNFRGIPAMGDFQDALMGRAARVPSQNTAMPATKGSGDKIRNTSLAV